MSTQESTTDPTPPMKDILGLVKNYRKEAVRRAKAHYLSAEYHRSRGVLWSLAANCLTAIVGAGIFTAFVDRITISTDTLGRINSTFFSRYYLILVFVVALILIAAPVVTAIQTSLHNAEDAVRHAASASGYERIWKNFDIFFLQYDGTNLRDQALNDLKAIVRDYNTVLENSLILTPKAYKDADEEILEEEKQRPAKLLLQPNDDTH